MSTIKADNVQTLAGASAPMADVVNGSARAWVDFDGITAGTPIRQAYNVSSITDNGVGDYSVNFSTAFSDANYSALVSIQSSVSGTGGLSRHTSQTASVYRFLATDAGPNATDFSRVRVAVFR